MNKMMLACAALLMAAVWTTPPAGAQTLFGMRAEDDRYTLSALDLTDGSVRADIQSRPRRPEERLDGLFLTLEGRLALVRTDVSRKGGDAAEIDVLGAIDPSLILEDPLALIVEESVEILQTVGNLSRAESITSVVAFGLSAHIALAGHLTDTPPYRLVKIDPISGRAATLSEFKLSDQARYANLTQCPNGTLYATQLPVQGSTRLVRLAPSQRALVEVSILSLDGRGLRDDLRSLACSPNNQLYGLGDPGYRGVNSVFTIEVTRGQLKEVAPFDVDKISFIATLVPKNPDLLGTVLATPSASN